MKLFFRIILFSLLFVFCGCNIKKTKSYKSYSFFVAGHTYGKPGVNNKGLHPPFKKKFDFINEQEQIVFGVLTGDIVFFSSNRDWNEVDADLCLINVPVHFAVGNHDIEKRELYERRYGKTYSSFIHEDDLFIILDPNLDKWNISGDQLQFLKDTLNSNHNKVKNIFVFFHQLLWWGPKNEYKRMRPNSVKGRSANNFWTEIAPLFSNFPNETYMFAGDVGAFNNGSEFTCHAYNNITMIASGMGGEVRDNFVIVDISENKTASFRLIALNDADLNALGKLEDFRLP